MTTTMLRRGMVLLLVLGMTIAGTVVPAFALATGSASLADDVFFAGTTSRLDVTVTNNAAQGGLPVLQPGGSNINAVQMLVDDSVVAPTDVNANAPEGWSGSFNAARGTVFYFAEDGFEIAPGASLEFNLPVDVAPGNRDLSSDIIVQVSDDNGTTATNAGVELFDIKVLEVVEESVTIVKPVATQPANLVTEFQDNARVQLRVKSYANTGLGVTASAVKAGGSSTVTVSDSGPLNIAAGGERTFNLPATFGAPGSLSIEGRATATNATAVVDTFSGITVQQAVALGYAGDLDPLAAVPGTSETFTFGVNKVGGPGATLSSTFAFGSDSKSQPISVDVNNVSQGLSYTIGNISSPDGTFGATLTYSGTDTNGAVIPEVELELDDILLDSLRPVLDFVLTPPPAAVDGAEDAAGASDSVGVSGTVTTDAGDLCGQCDIKNELVEFLGASGNVLGNQPGPNLTTSDGNISGSFTMPADVPTGTVTVRLTATAQRAENLLSASGEGSAEVDIVAPLGVDNDLVSEGVISVDGSVTTTGRDDDGDFINVPFSELVAFGDLAGAGDWGVDGNAVTEVRYLDGTAAGTAKVQLRLAQELDRNATPRVTYTPAFGPLARAFDRVELDLADQILEAADNIAPDVLGIVSVSTFRGKGVPAAGASGDRIDQGSFDGVFYTRDRTPVVTVNNVAVGDEVRVFQDNNGDGIQQGGERELGKVLSAAGETVEVTLNDIANNEVLINISAYAIDAAGNSGLGSIGDELQLEFTAPTIESFVRTNNTVTVTFTEPVPVGRDAAFDWLVFSNNRYRPVDAVSNTDGDDRTRTLTINGAVVPGEVTAVRWESITPDTSDDYADRARNEAAAEGLELSQ